MRLNEEMIDYPALAERNETRHCSCKSEQNYGFLDVGFFQEAAEEGLERATKTFTEYRVTLEVTFILE